MQTQNEQEQEQEQQARTKSKSKHQKKDKMQSTAKSNTSVKVPKDSLRHVISAIEGFTAWTDKNHERIAANGTPDQLLTSYNLKHCRKDGSDGIECRYAKALEDGFLPCYYVCPGCEGETAFCCLIEKAYEAGYDSTKDTPWEKLICTNTDKCNYWPHLSLSIDVQVRAAALKGVLSARKENLVDSSETQETTLTGRKKARARSDDVSEASRTKRARVCKK